MTDRELTPREIVAQLDKYIIGQHAAKRAVAVALRNRYRRQLLPAAAQEEIYPKNILMIGPTGVGKTEIARRLARLVRAPFIKVEATKFTEVGYVGRDVESMVRDLAETAVRMVRADRMTLVADEAERLARERLLDIMVPVPGPRRTRSPLESLLGALTSEPEPSDVPSEREEIEERRRAAASRLDAGELDDERIDIEVEESGTPMVEVFSGAGVEEMGINLQDALGGLLPRRKKRRRTTVSDARRILVTEEAARLVDAEQCAQEAVELAEQTGIIFIDELDKIVGRERAGGPDVSREGVQRDILPIVEGSTVQTKYGPVRTDHVLFIAAGAFHTVRPSDLIPELQGRFPIRVELESLEQEDFRRILTEPKNALTRQYGQLLATEGVTLEFADDAIDELAASAVSANEQAENIGARRLHTLLERVLEDLSFEAPDLGTTTVTITAAFVRERLADALASDDLSRYIL